MKKKKTKTFPRRVRVEPVAVEPVDLTPPQCGDLVEIGLTAPAFGVQAVFQCTREAGHPKQHMALGVTPRGDVKRSFAMTWL